MELHKCQGGDFYTDGRFWDCECEKYFIHARNLNIYGEPVRKCDLCGVHQDDGPDSRVKEIAIGGKFSSDYDFLIAYNLSEYYDSLDKYG
jgi:hypothetical protein